MSFKTNENQQISMEDSLKGLSERELKILKGSWAEDFANFIFPNIPEAPFSVLFSEKSRSKPNVPINIILGLFMLKEQFDLTDEELMEQMLFNIQFQYALHTTSCFEQPINDNTLRRFRNRIAEYEAATGIDLVKEAFNTLKEKTAEIMGMNATVRRVDSLMISAGCRKLSRLSIMGETLRLAAREIGRSGNATPLTGKYYEENGSGSKDIGYRLKRGEVAPKMEEMLRDAMEILDAYPEELAGSETHAALKRMIEDQSKEDGEGGRTLKEGKEISPESMQTPHDPGATYRNKGGKGNVGYVANVDEACDGDKRLINGYDLQQNTYSDAKFAEDMIETVPEGSGKQTIVFDGAYASTELLEKAEEKNVEIATTSLIGGMDGTFVAGFKFDGEGNISECPAGHSPMDAKHGNGFHQAHFDAATCENCHHCGICPGVFQAKAALIKFSDKALAKAQYEQKTETEKFRELAKLRNGIDGVQSVLRRKYGIDRVRDKGAVRKRHRLGFVMMAINAGRLIKWRKNTAKTRGLLSVFCFFYNLRRKNCSSYRCDFVSV